MYNRDFAPNGFVVATSAAAAPNGDYYGFIVHNTDLVVGTAEFVPSLGAPASGAINGMTFKPGFYPMRLKNLVVTSGSALVYRN
jgi:pectin methylesterase-like acyl-CoA thioesterase